MTWTEERISEIFELRKEGLSYGEISARLGVSRDAVLGAVRRRRLATEQQETPLNSNQRKWLEIRGGFRRQAGIRNSTKLAAEDLAPRFAEIPEEDRDLTGQLMGDPPRHDPRRTWAPHLAREQA